MRTSPGRIGTFAEISPLLSRSESPHGDAQLLFAITTQDHCAIARRERREPTTAIIHVQDGHVGEVGQRLRLLRLADDANLLGVRAHEARDDHVHGRRAYVLGEPGFHVA